MAAVAAVVCAVLALVVMGVFALGGILPGGSSDVVVSPEEVFTDEMFYSLPEEGHVAVDDGTGLVYVNDEMLLYAEESAGQAEVEQLVADMGGEIVGRIAETRSYQVRFEDAMEYGELERLISQIEDDELVSAAFPNYIIEMEDAAETSDPAWGDSDKVWAYEAINLPAAWDVVTADSSVTVGICDNQFYAEHEDLTFASVVQGGYDIATGDHGTFIAGIIGANANDKGSVGVAYGCSMAGISEAKWAERQTSSEGYETAYQYEFAITYLVVMENARVINISMAYEELAFCAAHGNENALEIVETQTRHQSAYLKALLDDGYDFVVCKAAGNSNDDEYIEVAGSEPVTIGETTYYFGFVPKNDDTESYWGSLSDGELQSRLVVGDVSAEYDLLSSIADEEVASRIIVVGAVESAGDTYAVTEYSCGGGRVDLVAPGGSSSLGVYSTSVKIRIGLFEYAASSGYGSIDGTSIAAPMVSGVAALVYSANPDLTGDQVKDIICSTASGSYRSSGSFDDTYGLLDAEAAVEKALSYDAEAASGGSSAGVLEVVGAWEIDAARTMVETGASVREIFGSSIAYGSEMVFGEDGSFSYYIAAGIGGEGTWEYDGGQISYQVETYEEGAEERSTLEVTEDGCLVYSYFGYEVYWTKTDDGAGGSGGSGSSAGSDASAFQVFSQLPDTFTFASGVGGWGTAIELADDGSFTGQFHDSELGDTGNGYPDGTVYLCDFSGKFGGLQQIDEYIYSMTLEYLDVENAAGGVYYEDGTRYVYADPYGFDDAGEFLVYLPGCPASGMDEAFLGWLQGWLSPSLGDAYSLDALPTGYYGIYNVAGQEGFVGVDG